MATIRQIEANRLNALKSTGPRSVEGKARSSMNALKSGIHAQSEVIRGEDLSALESLTAEYIARFCPTTPEQRYYVDTLIRADWQIRRLAVAEAQLWERGIAAAFPRTDNPLAWAVAGYDRTFALLQRRIDSIQRIYDRALRELQRLQATPDPEPAPPPAEEVTPHTEIGFVPVTEPEADHSSQTLAPVDRHRLLAPMSSSQSPLEERWFQP